MSLYKLKRKKIIEVLTTLFFFFLFLNDNTVYSGYFDKVGKIFLVIAILCMILTCTLIKNMKFNRRFLIFIIIWFMAIALNSAINGISYTTMVRFAYCCVTFFVICLLYAENIDLIKCLIPVLKIYCIWSLICYIYTILDFDFLPITSTSNLLLYNTYNVNLYGFIISKPISHLNFAGFSFLRLDRPFGEPGIAQMYFNLGIIIYLFKKDKYNISFKYFLLFLISTILSFSLTGYLVLLGIIFVYLLWKKKYNIMVVYIIIMILTSVFMIYQKKDTFSYIDRKQDYFIMFDLIAENLPFGLGIGNTSIQISDFYDVSDVSVGLYCGLLYPLLEYGIVGIIYYVALIKGIKNFSENKFCTIAFGVFLLFTLLTQPQAEEPFVLCFIFNGLLKVSNNRLIRGENKIE